jgi:ParB family chromosome partitioning protein
MSKSNKFGFSPLSPEGPDAAPRRDRRPGPMGAAVRETAENVAEATEAKIEQRRRNAEDAKAWRAASEAGRVLTDLPLSAIRTDALPRDRLELEAVAQSDEMEELKASIRARGQREPIEVWPDGEGYQLKKGWRRLTALGQLHAETGEARFGTVVARVERGPDDRLARYVDMVEENVVREDLTFAEMAQVAIAAAEDEAVDETDPDAMVGRLYGALHKTKRSYIRAFVFLLGALGPDLRFPKAVGRNLGVDASRALRKPEAVEALRERLAGAADAEAQNRILSEFVEAAKRPPAPAGREEVKRPKLEFHVGATKVTARDGECRIVSRTDFAEVPRDRLERAIRAFEDALKAGPHPRKP